MPKYELKSIPAFNIADDGRSIEVKVTTDNIGRTRIQFGTLFHMIVDANDLETLVDNLNVALDDHKDISLSKLQEALPFEETAASMTETVWPANDPRGW